MNFTPFNGHFSGVHQFAAAKFNSPQIQPGTMIVTTAADGTIQYIRPEHNGPNFIASSASSSPVQAIPVAVNIPVSSESRLGNDQETMNAQSAHHLAVVNTPVSKYAATPSAILGWGEFPVMHHFNEANKNLAALNVPYPHQAVNNGAAAFLTMQPPHSAASSPAMWPVKLMQSVATMTSEESEAQPQDLCKGDDNKSKDTPSEVSKESALKSEQKDSCDSEDDSDDSSKSGGNDLSHVSSGEHRNQPGQSITSLTALSGIECTQMQLQQQGSAMADYLARLPATTIPLSLQHFLKYQTENSPAIKREGESGSIPSVFLGGAAITPVNSAHPDASIPKKKKKKKSQKKPPRPKPGEIRLSTALDGSTLFCCPECHMAYPDRELLQQHMGGHKLERKFVCNICGAGLKRKEHLDQHKKGHSDERPFVCSVCLKGFKRNEHLTRHFVIHSGEKMHSCWECGKKFSRKDHLHKHTQTHIAKRVKAEMSQDGTPHPPAPPPPHPVIPNIPHPLQLHHAMS